MKTSKRDDQIDALQALVLSLAESPAHKVTGAMYWVFSSQTASGAWRFTYKVSIDCPGEGWKAIPRQRIDSATITGMENDSYTVSVGATP